MANQVKGTDGVGFNSFGKSYVSTGGICDSDGHIFFGGYRLEQVATAGKDDGCCHGKETEEEFCTAHVLNLLESILVRNAVIGAWHSEAAAFFIVTVKNIVDCQAYQM